MTTTLHTLTPEFLADLKAKRDAIWNKLPPFDLERAKAGEPYICRIGLEKQRAYCDVREIAGPNSGWMIWAGEWCVFTEDEEVEMHRMFRMYRAEAFEGGAR